jgi:hypothetical protein
VDEPKATTTRVLRQDFARALSIQDFEGLPFKKLKCRTEKSFAISRSRYDKGVLRVHIGRMSFYRRLGNISVNLQ